MNSEEKDWAFFQSIESDDRLPQPPYDHAAVAKALGELVYTATDRRLEAGCDQSSPLGQIVDYSSMITPLGAIRTMARKLVADSSGGPLPIFDLTHALMAEARECGIGGGSIPRMAELAIAYIDFVKA